MMHRAHLEFVTRSLYLGDGRTCIPVDGGTRDVDSELAFGLIARSVLCYVRDFVIARLEQLSRFLFYLLLFLFDRQLNTR